MASLPSQQPLVNELKRFADRSHAAFYTPGHKRGQGVSASFRELLSDTNYAQASLSCRQANRPFTADLPELPGLDNLFNPEGVIHEAQVLAAQTFGAKQSWFLANGSTCGIEAAVLAVCKPGDKIIVPRNLHQSVVSALILSGVVPVFVAPEVDTDLGIAHGVSMETVKLALEQHPDSRAILLVYPTYYGVGCDVRAIAHLAHAHSIPLLVDEAHGAHFAFHRDLPPSALSQGADLTVQSTHKTLAALTQASMLHIQGDRISADRVSRALQLVQSSSPSYLLLASLDAAQAQMAENGFELMHHALDLAVWAREAIAQIPGLRVFDISHPGSSGCTFLDLTRLTVDVSGLGITGFDADDILHEQLGVTAELPGLKTLTFIISLGNTAKDIDRLIRAFKALARQTNSEKVNKKSLTTGKSSMPEIPAVSVPSVSPRDAFFAATEPVAIAHAIGRISTETICPYPPGIPALLPGERITAEAVEVLQAVNQAGGVITGCADSTLETLNVVRSPSHRPAPEGQCL